MSNEIMNLDFQQLRVVKGQVSFNQYEQLLEEANELASNISGVEVTEDTVKASKKLMAAVTKKVNALEDVRKDIKKQLLEPYETFESQVKEIVSIVNEANNTVRTQVKTLEEKERMDKELEIYDIYKKRIKRYAEVSEIFSFKDFLKPKHLNKTSSLSKVEDEMVQYLEDVQKDLDVISTMDNSIEILAEYKDTKNFATAVRIVNERHNYVKQLEESKKVIAKTFEKPKEEQAKYKIEIFSDFGMSFIEKVLQENEIKFKKYKL